MKRKHLKLLRVILAALLAINQMFLYRPVLADETEETQPAAASETKAETVAETKEETASETALETTSEKTDASSGETEAGSVKETTEAIKEDEAVRSAKNGKEFIRNVSKLPKKYRIAASTKKGMPKLKGAEGVDYGGSCVLSFKNKADYDKALKDLEKKDIDYSLDGSVELCSAGNGSFYKDVKINPNAKAKVALIDTGSEIANEKISLLGDDGTDGNGHGTSMARLILSETDDAYIISVKAVGNNGKGKLADVYAGLRYAIDHKADYILMALSLKDNGDYEEFVSLVREAAGKGIKVIASAGNNNSEASDYIPAGIKGVITAGATDEEGHKLGISNYGECVDYYIRADSTSEAAAILTGLLIAGKEEECPTDYITADDESDRIDEPNDGPEFSVDKSKMTWPTQKDLIAAGYRNSDDFANAVIKACKAMKGANYGTGNGKADCMRYVNLAYAQALNLISGLKVNSKGNIPGVKRSNGNVTYNGVSLTNSKFHLVDGCTTWSKKSPHNIGAPGGINIENNGGLAASLKKLGAKKGSIILFGGYNNQKIFKYTHAAIYAGSGKNVYDAPGGSQTTGVMYSKSEAGSGDKTYTHVAVLNYDDFSLPALVTVTKKSTDPTIVNNNACYSIEGTRYGFYTSDGKLIHEFVLDADGKSDQFEIPDVNGKYYFKEIAAGKGYKLSDTTFELIPKNYTANLISYNAKDDPIGADGGLMIEKKDRDGWGKYTGSNMNSAWFRVDYYDTYGIESYKDLFDADGEPAFKPRESVTLTSTSALGLGEYEINAKFLRASTSKEYFAGFTGKKLPLGTYVITETRAPDGFKKPDPTKPVIMKIRQEGQEAVTYYSSDPTIYQVLEDRMILNEEIKYGKGLFLKKIVEPESVNADMRLYSPEGTTYDIRHKYSGLTVVTLVFGKDGKLSEVKYPEGVKVPAVIDENGAIRLPEGEYTARELHSGYGLYLDKEVKEFSITENTTTEIEFQDEPVFTRFDLLIKKVKAGGLSDEVISRIPVSDAEFTLSYYADFYEDDSYKDRKPDREWVFSSDDEGIVSYDQDHFISGDALFCDIDGNYLVPQGTYVIKETKAPEGTKISSETRTVVVRFPRDIVKGSSNDPANKKASESTVYDNNLSDFKDGKIDYFNDYPTSIATKAVSTANGTKQIAAEKGVGITDTLTYENLLPGYIYKVKAWVVRSDGTSVTEPFDTTLKIKDKDGRSGTLDIPVVIDASGLKGETLTFMEEVYLIDQNGKEHLYLKHTDIENRDQQVTVPDIKTELIDKKIDEFSGKDNSKIVSYGKDVTITDYVTYKNLIPGKKYKMTGTLLDKTNGKPLLDSKGKKITSSKEFTPEKSGGTVTVEFEHVDTTAFTGPVVAGEQLYSDGISLITHIDVDDEDQTIRPVRIKTSASDSNNGTKTLNYSETADIKDTVFYTGLKEGKNYKITATLIDKATGKAYEDKDGTKYVKTLEFTANTADGKIEVLFEKVKLTYEYKELVVYERLTDMKHGSPVAVHEDINDKDQTVFRPQATTVARSSTGTKTIDQLSGITSITDKVMYKGLTAGNTYCAVATLYKTNGKQIMKDGNPVTGTVLFKPEKSDGTVEVMISFDVDLLNLGDSVVIFENLFDVATDEEKQNGTQKEDLEIVRHNDLKNKDQTLSLKSPVIPKTGEETSPALMIGLLLVGASAGPAGFAFRVKRGAKCRVPRRSRKMPDVSSLLCSLRRRMRDGSSRVWRNLNP